MLSYRRVWLVPPLFREERWGRNLLTEAGSDHYLSPWGLGGGGRSLDFGRDKIKFTWSPQRSCCGSPLYSLLATTERTGPPSENQVISPKSPDPPPSPKQHWLAHKLHPLKLHFFFTVCLQGWSNYGGNCYRASDAEESEGKIEWSEAADKCYNLNSHLVSIYSESENQFVKSLTERGRKTCSWIGLKFETRNQLHWNDGSLVNFTKWKDKKNAHECVAYHKESEVWENKPCSERCSFVCKRKGRSSLIFMLISSLIIGDSVEILAKFWTDFGGVLVRSQGKMFLRFQFSWAFHIQPFYSQNLVSFTSSHAAPLVTVQFRYLRVKK